MSAIFRFTRLLPLLLVLLLLACHSDEKPTPPRPKPTPAPVNIHIVQAGDTLYRIGVAYQENYQTLAQLNNIAPPYTLTIGQSIRLPASAKLKHPRSETITQPLTVTYSAKLAEPEFTKLTALPEQTAEPTTPEFDVYEVKAGDTLYSLSRRFATTPEQLSALNNIASPEQLHAGQNLKISKSKQKHSLVNNLQILKNPVEKASILSHKTSIISNNNDSMLKLYHQLPAHGKIIKNFAATGNRGIEIGGKLGQMVKTIASGQVVAVKPAVYGYGVFIIIQHANGYLSTYANNKQALVKVGQTVKQGQAIARMGQVGLNIPSVKFEIRKEKQFIDPLLFLAQKI